MSRRTFAAPLAAVAAAAALLTAGTATAAVPPVSNPRAVAHFDLSSGQSPENLAVAPDGSALLSLTGSRQIVRVTPTGRTSVLATLPAGDPADQASIAGLVRAGDGTVFVAFRSGAADRNGIWRLSPSGTLKRFAALPVGIAVNGLAADTRTGVIYGTDSSQGTVWSIPTRGGSPAVWSADASLRPGTGPGAFGFGANGVKVHGGALWVSNSDRGTLLRLAIRPDGSAGAVETRVSGLTGVDDFSFTGGSDTVVAALNSGNEVAVVAPDGKRTTVLSGEDGLQTPTATAVRGGTVYVTSAAYFTGQDPNLLLADIAPTVR